MILKRIKDQYHKTIVIISNDLEMLYSIVNDREYKPFNGEKFYQTWLKSKERQKKKKNSLADFLKD